LESVHCPNVDLDLWVEMPDGSMVHPGNLTSGPAEMANISDGAVSSSSEEAGGYCEGEADRDCEDFEGTEADCPDTCQILREEAGGTCFSEPTACREWWRDFVYCPIDCRQYCDPEVDPGCPNECLQSNGATRVACFECSGSVQVDRGCTEQNTQNDCENQDDGCFWVERPGEATCVGGRVRCENLNQQRCSDVSYCTWNQPPAVERLEFPPYIERIVFNRAITRPITFWVVNREGADTNEQIPFEAAVRVRDGVDYKLQGFVGPEAGSRSIEYRYELGESQ